jgi:hypothetical protein
VAASRHFWQKQIEMVRLLHIKTVWFLLKLFRNVPVVRIVNPVPFGPDPVLTIYNRSDSDPIKQNIFTSQFVQHSSYNKYWPHIIQTLVHNTKIW